MNKENILTVICVFAALIMGCKSLDSSVESKKGELFSLKVDDSKKSTEAKLKAKIAVVVKDDDGISVNYWAGENISKNKANNVDEIATLIRVVFDKNVGKVEIIDYKTKTLLTDFQYDSNMFGKPKDKEEVKRNDELVRKNVFDYLNNLTIE
jgi:hypothetical protein